MRVSKLPLLGVLDAHRALEGRGHARARVRLVAELEERDLERQRGLGRAIGEARRLVAVRDADALAPEHPLGLALPLRPLEVEPHRGLPALLLGGRGLGLHRPHEARLRQEAVHRHAHRRPAGGDRLARLRRRPSSRRPSRRPPRRAASRPAPPRTRGGWRPPSAPRSSFTCSSLDAAWKPNETMPRSRWLRCGSSATSHCSCVAIGACRRKWRAGAPAAAGSKASTTDTCGWYSSATSTTSLPATAKRFSRPGAGRRLLEGHRERPAHPEAGHRDLQGLLEERHPVRRLALEERHVRVEAAVEGDDRAHEHEQEADVGGQKADVVLRPGVAAHHHGEDVQAEHAEDEGEPGGLVDVALRGRGAVAASRRRWRTRTPSRGSPSSPRPGGARRERPACVRRSSCRSWEFLSEERQTPILGAALGRCQ